jgi:thioredoxin 1
MSVITLNQQNFDPITQNNTTLVDFYADWCGPCKMIAPIVHQIAEERSDITVGKVNVDKDGEIALKYNVMSIPTLIVFKNGSEVSRIVGYKPKEAILKILG